MYPREQPLAENLFFALRNLGKGFVGKYGSFTVSYEPATGFVRDQLLMEFIAKSLRVSYETVKDHTFLRNLFLSSVAKKNRFLARDSSCGYAGRTFTGSVELKIRFLNYRATE